MHTGPPSESIRRSIVGNNKLEYAYDYIRWLLVFIRVLGLRQEKPDGTMYEVVWAFADRFEHLDQK